MRKSCLGGGSRVCLHGCNVRAEWYSKRSFVLCTSLIKKSSWRISVSRNSYGHNTRRYDWYYRRFSNDDDSSCTANHDASGVQPCAVNRGNSGVRHPRYPDPTQYYANYYG